MHTVRKVTGEVLKSSIYNNIDLSALSTFYVIPLSNLGERFKGE